MFRHSPQREKTHLEFVLTPVAALPLRPQEVPLCPFALDSQPGRLLFSFALFCVRRVGVDSSRMVNRGPGGEGADAGVTLSPDQDRSRRTLVHRAIAGGRTCTMRDVSNSVCGNNSYMNFYFLDWARPPGGKLD